MTIYVHIGPVALREGRFWRGWMSGNRPCAKLRRTPKRALKDAANQRGEPMSEIRLVVTTFGEFRIITRDEWGNVSQAAGGYSLEDCLKQATAALGFPLSLPIVRADA